MKAETPPIFSPDIPGPWGVDTIGRVWCVIHRTTLRAKQIGRVGSRATNYFDRAIAEANERNRKAAEAFDTYHARDVLGDEAARACEAEVHCPACDVVIPPDALRCPCCATRAPEGQS